jgi:hypothetical protein
MFKVKFSVKRLQTISSSLFFANYVRIWESVDMEVEFLFGGGYFPLEMLRKSGKGWHWRNLFNNGQVTETSHNCGYALDVLLSAAPRPNERSGRYRLITALPL